MAIANSDHTVGDAQGASAERAIVTQHERKQDVGSTACVRYTDRFQLVSEQM